MKNLITIAALIVAVSITTHVVPAGESTSPLIDGHPTTTGLLSLTFNGFDLRVYEAGTNGRPGSFPTDDDRKVLLGPICAFLREPASGGAQFTRRQGPAGMVFFDVPIRLRAPGVQEKAAAEINRVKGWDIDPQNVLWLELTAVTVAPEYDQLFGEGVRAGIGREGFIQTRDVEVVTFALRQSAADSFERALVQGHNFLFRYEARVRDPIHSKIEIRTRDLVDVGFLRDLKGPSGARYVTRAQALELLRQATHRLSIRRWVDLEVPGDVLREMITKAFETLTSQFWQERAVPMSEFSMAELGKLRIDPADPSFTPDLMRRMALDFHMKDERELLAKYRSEVRELLKTHNERQSGNKSGGSFSFLKLFSLGGNHQGSKKRVDDYTNEEERLLDLVKEIKTNVDRSFHFEKEGEFYMAKSILLYDVQDLTLDDDRVLSDEMVIDRRGFRTDPYKRNSRLDLWMPSVELLRSDPRLERLLKN